MSPAVGLPLRPRVFGPFVSILTVATSFIIGLKVADIPAGPPSAHNSQVVHFPQQRPSRVRYHRTFSRALWFRYQPPQGRAPSGTDQSFSQRKPVRFYVFAVEDGSDLRSLDALVTGSLSDQIFTAHQGYQLPIGLVVGDRAKGGFTARPKSSTKLGGARTLRLCTSRAVMVPFVSTRLSLAFLARLVQRHCSALRAKVAEIQSKIRAGVGLTLNALCIRASSASNFRSGKGYAARVSPSKVSVLPQVSHRPRKLSRSETLRVIGLVASWSASPSTASYATLDEPATFVKAFLPLECRQGGDGRCRFCGASLVRIGGCTGFLGEDEGLHIIYDLRQLNSFRVGGGAGLVVDVCLTVETDGLGWGVGGSVHGERLIDRRHALHSRT
ncbi:hypothetical protein BDZ89DRAFT_1137710 [Hymenopellis radicata]|nr:hypothetical protein BDZ89DRAFT_1145348 [Hymenopellis radicata]KAF9021884.1 hypothetical protein BDZ89DRAFT_1137710 [Hymenopellis radicata]